MSSLFLFTFFAVWEKRLEFIMILTMNIYQFSRLVRLHGEKIVEFLIQASNSVMEVHEYREF